MSRLGLSDWERGFDAGAAQRDELLAALQEAHRFISQPQRMTPSEISYDPRPYNKLTATLRAAIAKVEGQV